MVLCLPDLRVEYCRAIVVTLENVEKCRNSIQVIVEKVLKQHSPYSSNSQKGAEASVTQRFDLGEAAGVAEKSVCNLSLDLKWGKKSVNVLKGNSGCRHLRRPTFFGIFVLLVSYTRLQVQQPAWLQLLRLLHKSHSSARIGLTWGSASGKESCLRNWKRLD